MKADIRHQLLDRMGEPGVAKSIVGWRASAGEGWILFTFLPVVAFALMAVIAAIVLIHRPPTNAEAAACVRQPRISWPF